MGVTAQTARSIAIGAGDVYVDGAVVGATEDNNVFRVTRTYFTPKFNGIPWKLKGVDYIEMEEAELEVTIPEIRLETLGYVIPGGVATPGDAAGSPKAGGENTTLAAASAIGATNIKLTDVASLVAGDVIVIGAAGYREYRSVVTVGTAGAGGTGVDFLGPLTLAHANLDPVIEVVSTTLAADSAIGAQNIKVASVAGLAIGSYIRVGYPGEQEMRLLTAVGTAGAGGTGLSFDVPMTFPHRLGDLVALQTNEGSATFTSGAGTARRLPSSAYHNWKLEVPGLDGRLFRFAVSNAIAHDAGEFAGNDAGTLKPRLKLMARVDGAAPTASPWEIDLVAPLV